MKWFIRTLLFLAVLGSIFYGMRWLYVLNEKSTQLAGTMQNRRFTSSWVRNAEFADRDRHLQFAAAVGRGELEQFPEDFPIIGHRIVPGRGDILSTRLFVRKYGGMPGASVSHERLTIFLPDGLPEKGQEVSVKYSGTEGAIAIISRGSALNPTTACFGYARDGVVGVAGAMPEGPVDTAVSENIYAPNNGDVVSDVSDVIVYISLEFDMYWMTGKGSAPCALPGTDSSGITTNRYGVMDTFIFTLNDIATLSPWEGNVSGPITKLEFGPAELVETEPMVRGHYNY